MPAATPLHIARPARLLLVLLLAGMLAGGGQVQPVLARSHAATPYACPFPSMQYTLTCYPPNQKRTAERLLRHPAVDPSTAVRRVTGLPLTLITAARRLLPTPSRHVNLLTFDYGTVPQNTDSPDPSVPATAWVEVTEIAHVAKGVKGMQFTRGYQCTGSTTGGTTTCGFGYWTLAENLPAHHLSLVITTSLSKATLRRIGQALTPWIKRRSAGA